MEVKLYEIPIREVVKENNIMMVGITTEAIARLVKKAMTNE